MDSLSVADLCRHVPIGDAGFRPALMRGLVREMSADAAFTFLPTRTTGGWEARHVALCGLGRSFERRLATFMRRAPPHFACFDPLHPARRDINVVVALSTKKRRLAKEGSSLWHDVFRRTELEHHDRLRLLICDGRDPLAVLVVLSARPFTGSQKRRLSLLTPTLVARFCEERHRIEREWRREALDLSLELMGRPALILDRDGRIERTNGAAKRRLRDQAFLDGLRVALDTGAEMRWKLAPLRSSNGRRLMLAVRMHESGRAQARVEAAAAIHDLTSHQRQVLELLLRGMGNKDVATALRCSVKTVEYHVSRLFRHFGVQTRTELTAVVWEQTS